MQNIQDSMLWLTVYSWTASPDPFISHTNCRNYLQTWTSSNTEQHHACGTVSIWDSIQYKQHFVAFCGGIFLNPSARQNSLQNCKELHCKGLGKLLSHGTVLLISPTRRSCAWLHALRTEFCFLKNSKTIRHRAIKENRQLLIEAMNFKWKQAVEWLWGN